MKIESYYLTKDAKVGDIYYFNLCDRYYFLQILNIDTSSEIPEHKYKYLVAVFEKSYSKLPENKDETDFKNIYRAKSKPKNELLYVCLMYEEPELKFLWYDAEYKDRKKYPLTYWGNRKVHNAYHPKITLEYVPDACYTEEESAFTFAEPDSANIGYIFWRILEDIKHKNKKIKNISPKYFPQWLNEVDADVIVKIEKILTVYEADSNQENVDKTLKKCIKSINKLDEKENFVGTIEREDICEKIIEISTQNGINDTIVEKIIDDNRDW